MKLQYPQHKEFMNKNIYNRVLDICNGGNYDEMVYKAEELGYGFAFVYHYNLRKIGSQKNQFWNKYRTDATYSSNYTLTLLNTVSKELREELDLVMQEYLYSTDGVIDSWPVPFVEGLFKTEGVEFLFDYFAGDYTEKIKQTREGHVITKTTSIGLSSKKQYRNHYIVPLLENYKRWKYRIWELERKIEEANRVSKNNKVSRTKIAIIYTPFIISVVYALLWCFWSFTETSSLQDIQFIQVFVSMYKSDNILLKILGFIPFIVFGAGVALWYIFALMGSLFGIEKIIVVMFAIMAVLTGGGISNLIYEKMSVSSINDKEKKLQEEARRAKEEIEDINRDKRYIRAKADQEQYAKEERSIAQQWHKEWYKQWEEEYSKYMN